MWDELVSASISGLMNTTTIADCMNQRFLTVAEHDLDFGHHILLNKARILAKKSRCMNWLIWEVMEMKLQLGNMNHEDMLFLSRLWRPATYLHS